MSKLKIMSHNIDIEFVPDEYWDEGKYGEAVPREGKIYLSEKMPKDVAVVTLIHEALHHYTDMVRMELEEEDVQRLALFFYALCRENGNPLTSFESIIRRGKNNE